MRHIWILVRTLPNFLCSRLKQSQLSHPLTLSGAPIPETSLWAFSAFAPVQPCLSCTGDPKNGSRSPDVISKLLNGRGGSPPSTCSHFLYYSRNDVCPSLPSCFPDGQPQACSSVWCRIWHLPLLNILSFLSVHFSSLSRCPWVVAEPSADPAPADSSSQFCTVCRLAEGALLHCLVH